MSAPDDVGKVVMKLFRILTNEEVDKVKTFEDWVVRPDNEEAAQVLSVGPLSFDCEKFMELASPHPMTDGLSSVEMDTFQDSIAAHGIMDDVIIAPSGRIIDGFHRVLAACWLLRMRGIVIPVPCRVVEFVSNIAEAEYVTIQHVIRRHLDPKKGLRMAERLLLQGHEGTDRHIAILTGVSENTVTEYREKLEAQGYIKVLDFRYDLRGRRHARPDGGRKKRVRNASKTPVKTKKAKISDGSTRAAFPVELSVQEPKFVESNIDEQAAQIHNLKVTATREMGIEEADLNAPGKSSIEPQLAPTEADSNSEIILGNSAPIVQNDMAGLLVKKWWDHHGIMPVTCIDLKESLGGTGIDQRLTELVLNSTKLRLLIGKLVGHEVWGYLVQERLLGNNRIYYLRPAPWTIHGPK